MPPDAVGQTRIVTGEAVHLDMRVAGPGSRALARMVDLLIQVVLLWLLFLVGTIVLLVLSAGVVAADPAIFQAMLFAVVIAVFVGYPVMMETLTRGRTLGKMIFGLRVVRNDGGPVTFRQALTRTLIALSIEFPGLFLPPVTWMVAIWTMIANPLNKRVGDHVAGTIVIHERTPTAWGWVPAMPPGLTMWAATLDLADLDDDLAFAVRSFLARNRSLREPARSVLGERLTREVAAVVNPPPPPGTPAWMYLAAVHAERHQRAMRNLAAVRSRAAMVWPELTAAIAPPAVQARVPRGKRGKAPAQPNSALPQ
jgi:uncharacterized RDD family membrane protein YckC